MTSSSTGNYIQTCISPVGFWQTCIISHFWAVLANLSNTLAFFCPCGNTSVNSSVGAFIFKESNEAFAIKLSYIKIGPLVYLQSIQICWFLFLTDNRRKQKRGKPSEVFFNMQNIDIISTICRRIYDRQKCFWKLLSLKNWFCFWCSIALHLLASDLWRKAVKYWKFFIFRDHFFLNNSIYAFALLWILSSVFSNHSLWQPKYVLHYLWIREQFI